MQHSSHDIRLPDGRVLELGPLPVVMGILNVTPDSFSDGGDYVSPDAALLRARQMIAEGAGIVDVGGESTRPGAAPVVAGEELSRVLPVLERLRQEGMAQPVSIDTFKAEVANRALGAGASIVNDVHGLQRDPDMAGVVAQHGAPIIVMHWDEARDTSRDIIDEMKRYFARSLEIAARAGIAPDRIVLDPGFGFAKSLRENYQVLRELGRLQTLGLPLLVGTSRKSMIGRVLELPADQRLAGTLATTAIGYQNGGHIFRVHDVRPNIEALRIAQAVHYGPQSQ